MFSVFCTEDILNVFLSRFPKINKCSSYFRGFITTLQIFPLCENLMSQIFYTVCYISIFLISILRTGFSRVTFWCRLKYGLSSQRDIFSVLKNKYKDTKRSSVMVLVNNLYFPFVLNRVSFFLKMMI